MAASAIEAALHFAWPLVGGMVGFVAMLSVLAVLETASCNARNVCRVAVFPREVRVRAPAYMHAARNVGYTLGAGARGVALGLGTDAVRLVPLLTGALLVVNAVMIAVVLPPIARRVAVPTVEDGLTAPPAAWRNRGFVVLAACQRRAVVEPGAAQRRCPAVAGGAHGRAAGAEGAERDRARARGDVLPSQLLAASLVRVTSPLAAVLARSSA